MSGTDRIQRAFRRAREEGRLGFVPFVTAGEPDLDGTRRLAAALAGAGADVLEVGVPWNRPAVDGPAPPRATGGSSIALTSLDALLTTLPAVTKGADLPVVLSADLDSLLRFGPDEFADRAVAAGVDGVLLAEPSDPVPECVSALRSRGLATIFLAGSAISDDRLRAIAAVSSGFMQITTSGVSDAAVLPARIREHTTLPVAVGCGVSGAEEVAALRGSADAFVAGTAVTEILERLGATDEGVEAVAALARTLLDAGRTD